LGAIAPITTVEVICSFPANQYVIATPSSERIIPGSAPDCVVLRISSQDVIVVRAMQVFDGVVGIARRDARVAGNHLQVGGQSNRGIIVLREVPSCATVERIST